MGESAPSRQRPGDHGQVQWTDARVVIVDVLCTAEQQEQLVSQVTGALRAFEERVVAKQGRWVTTGIRLRESRDDAERAWLVESLAQPDDTVAIEVGLGSRDRRNGFTAERRGSRRRCTARPVPG